jgi:hypothetical protein
MVWFCQVFAKLCIRPMPPLTHRRLLALDLIDRSQAAIVEHGAGIHCSRSTVLLDQR